MKTLRQIENLIQKDFVRVSAFDAAQNIRKDIIKYRAVIVYGDQDEPIGILTIYDILERPRELVIDCMRIKRNLSSDITVFEAIEILQEEREEALAVQEAGEIIGLIFKDELLSYLRKHINALTTEVSKADDALKKISWIQSHRVRQPVASILGLIQLIDRGLTHEDLTEIIPLLRRSIVELDKVIAETVITADYFRRENAPQGTQVSSNVSRASLAMRDASS